MLVESFRPSVDVDGNMVAPLNLSVTGTSQRVAFPKGDGRGLDHNFEFTNEDTAIVQYVKFLKSDSGTVTAATGIPILPGQSKIYRLPEGHTTLAYIGASAGPSTLKVMPGRGM